MTIGIIILAAGASRRMGTPKQTLQVEKGKGLLIKTIETALATSLQPVIVVVGANKTKVVPELAGLPVTIVDNAFWAEGMATSIKIGLAGLFMTEPKLDGVLMLVCDQPYLTTKILEEMVVTYGESGKKAVACRYEKSWGVPVLIGRELLGEIIEIEGDHGAKSFLKNHREDVAFVDFPKGNIDLDTPEEYATFLTL